VALSAAPSSGAQAGAYNPPLSAAEISVSPQPNTHFASVRTQISFVGATKAELASIRVSGTHTHHHRGRLLAYSTGDGASFVSDRPFSAGETVRVRVNLPGGPLAFNFQVNRVAARKAPGPAQPGDNRRAQAFVSRPDLHPPPVSITRHQPGVAPGDLFVAPIGGPPPLGHKPEREIGQAGPMITDGHGRLVWFRPMPRGQLAFDFRPQALDGAPVLTWWQGRLSPLGYGYGEDLIADSSYRVIAHVRAGNGYHADIHEFTLSPRGTALITVYHPVVQDLSAIHGARAAVALDSIVQEIDIKTGLVRFEWHSADHIPLRETYVTAVPKTPIDPAHLNSVVPLADGTLLLSARNTWAVYDIDRRGRIVWRLGGKRSSFHMGPGTRFAYQHDAQLQVGGLLSVFDDSAAPPVARRSRGLTLKLDTSAHTARVAHTYYRGTTLAGSQGNMQTLANGNTLVGWGAEPFFSEFSPGGRLLLDGQFPRPDESYRAYSSPWQGQPAAPPTLVARPSGQHVNVYVSWNGATEVSRWQLLGGSTPGALAPTGGPAARSGFETRVVVRRPPRYLAVRALDRGGRTLGTSAPVKI
jgi:hypothetical protein